MLRVEETQNVRAGKKKRKKNILWNHRLKHRAISRCQVTRYNNRYSTKNHLSCSSCSFFPPSKLNYATNAFIIHNVFWSKSLLVQKMHLCKPYISWLWLERAQWVLACSLLRRWCTLVRASAVRSDRSAVPGSTAPRVTWWAVPPSHHLNDDKSPNQPPGQAHL